MPAIEKVTTLIHQMDARMDSIHIEEDDNGICTITFNTDFAGRRAAKRHESFIIDMTQDENIISISSTKITS